MKKNILLPSAFFTDVYRLILLLEDLDLDAYTKSLCASLESQIYAKFLALERHDSFCKYKSAPPGSDERQLFRRDYLDKTGILNDWISNDEFPSLP